ncbi:hypothetical protein B0H19DRAFT_1141093 [Mycena capillaripes]|nr:hypothetical protein B0H19DRAFT_1141093 [Mycena capillaripes]
MALHPHALDTYVRPLFPAKSLQRCWGPACGPGLWKFVVLGPFKHPSCPKSTGDTIEANR